MKPLEGKKKMYHWQRQFYQRNSLLRGLFDVGNEDHVIIADIDEIPSVETIEDILKDKILYDKIANLQMLFFYYSATNARYNLNKDIYSSWNKAKIVHGSHLSWRNILEHLKIERILKMQVGTFLYGWRRSSEIKNKFNICTTSQ